MSGPTKERNKETAFVLEQFKLITYIFTLFICVALFVYLFPDIVDFITNTKPWNNITTINKVLIFVYLILSLIHIGIVIFFNLAKKYLFKSKLKTKLISYIYVIKFSKFNWITLITFLVTLIHYELKSHIKLLNKIQFSSEIAIIYLSLITFTINTVYKIIVFNKDMYYLIDITSNEDKLKAQRHMKLEKDSVFEKRYYVSKDDSEYYLINDKVNYLLYKDSVSKDESSRIKMKINKNKYRIPKEVIKYAPLALKNKINTDAYLFNDRIVGQLSEIATINDNFQMKLNDIYINKVTYFDTLLSNELAYNKIIDFKEVESKFEGKKILVNENNELLNYNKSYLANHIGVNTLAISNDNYLIISTQGRKSDVSPGKYVNTGSGSLTYRDVIKNKNKSFKDIIIYGAERELKEECGLPNDTKIVTTVIGMIKVLKYSGKPDYFAVSKIDLTSSQIINYAINNSREISAGLMEMPLAIKLDEDIELNIIKAIDKLQNENIKKTTVQLNASKVMIKSLLKKGVNVFKDL